jgi:hypothetical protein
MSRRTSEASKAIREAWKNEQELVKVGKGTRDWTPQQQKDILEKGKAYDDEGRAFEGQHMKSAEKYPEYQSDSKNIQFLTREEHLEAHDNNWKNPTNWYYDSKTKIKTDFGDGKYIPCEIIGLTEPISRNLNQKKSENEVKDNATETECNKKYSKSNEVYEPLNNFITKGIKRINDCFLKHPKIAHAFKIFTPIVVSAGVVVTVAYKVKSSSTKRVSDCESESKNMKDYDDISLEKLIDENQSNDFVNDGDANLENEYSISYESRNSPQEHTVKGHKQRYHTKEGIIERDVASYQRGARKEDDLDE